jgi:hypothetical protein
MQNEIGDVIILLDSGGITRIVMFLLIAEQS